MHRSLGVSVAILAVLLAPAVFAQTVHDVDVGPGFNFTPALLGIQVGDIVRWTWLTEGHNVVSGDMFGIPTGIFSSGSPADPPNSFEVTFDAAFVMANPVVGFDYFYFCQPHVGFGMTGCISVEGAGMLFARGDCNADGGYGLPDAIFALQVLFQAGGPAPCVAACDANDDESFGLADVIYTLGNLFSGGPDPVPPFPDCGLDPTPMNLDCDEFIPCA